VFPVPPEYAKEDVEFLAGLLVKGQYRAVIDRSYPLEDAVGGPRRSEMWY